MARGINHIILSRLCKAPIHLPCRLLYSILPKMCRYIYIQDCQEREKSDRHSRAPAVMPRPIVASHLCPNINTNRTPPQIAFFTNDYTASTSSSDTYTLGHLGNSQVLTRRHRRIASMPCRIHPLGLYLY